MNDITTSTPDGPEAEAPRAGTVHRIKGGQVLPGEYWRARKKFKFLKPSTWDIGQMDCVYTAEKGEVLLIADVLLDGDQDHTVVLVPHPLKGDPKDRIRVLVGQFVDHFEFAPDAEQVRADEILAIQRQSRDIQEDIERAQRDPAYLNSQALKAIADQSEKKGSTETAIAVIDPVSALNILHVEPPTLSTALTTASAVEIRQTTEIVRSAAKLAEAQGRWLSQQTDKLVETTRKVVPFYAEKAQVALARTRRQTEKANRLLEGVATLTLFTGDGVTVHVIQEGQPAPKGTPVHLFQRCLVADQEMSFQTQYMGEELATAKSGQIFFDALRKSPALVEQMIPAPRGVVLARWSTNSLDGVEDTYLRKVMKEENAKAFLLIRDGERLLMVCSPIESHEAADMLFPEKDIDGTIFTGLNGERITPEDLRYVDRLHRLHLVAVHFRRAAVLLAGLISREVVFTDVEFSHLFDAARTDSLFRLVRDASGEDSLPDGRESLKAFLARTNSAVKEGSRVMANWRALTDEDNAPGAFGRRTDRQGNREQDWGEPETSVAVVERDGDTLYIRGTYTRYYRDETKIVRVRLFEAGRWTFQNTSLLCVDRLDTESLDRLMQSRDERQHYLNYMKLFKAARDYALQLQRQDAPLKAALVTALQESKLAIADAPSIADEAIQAWRGEHGKLPAVGSADFTKMLDRVYRQTKAGAIDMVQLDQLIAAKELDPLRLSLTASNKALLYVIPKNPDDRGVRQVEVDCFPVIHKARSGLQLGESAPAPMFVKDPEETILREWPAAQDRAIVGEPILRVNHKRRIINDIEKILDFGRAVLAGPLDDATAQRAVRLFLLARASMLRRSKYINPIGFALPFALVQTEKRAAVLTLATSADSILCANLPDHWFEVFARRDSDVFQNEKKRLDALRKLRAERTSNRPELRIEWTEARSWNESLLFQPPDSGYVYCYDLEDGRGQNYWSHSDKGSPLKDFRKYVMTEYDRDGGKGHAIRVGGDQATRLWLPPQISTEPNNPILSWLYGDAGAKAATT